MAIAPKEALELQSGAAGGGARDDARLVAALRAGDEGAFARLVTDYQTAIYNLAWRLVHDREDARDITQEVFLKAYRQIPRIQGELHLWAWLYRVTVNASLDHLRAGSRRPATLAEPREEVDRGAGDGQDQAEMARLFSASLAQLPPKQQVALLLKDVHGLQHSDIAATLGISRGSSEVLLFRARRSFRSAFTSMTVDAGRAPVCRFAEQAAAYSVGGRLTEARRRRVLAHARECPDCRATVERWTGAHAVGLGLALPLVAAPQIFGANAAASAAANLAASAGVSTSAAGASASAAATAGAAAAVSAGASAGASTLATAGASTVAGGLTAKLAGMGMAKAALVALAATTVVAGGGATAYKDYARDDGRRTPSVSVVSSATAHGRPSSLASPSPAASGPLTEVAAVLHQTPLVGDRLRQRLPGVRRFLALGGWRARGPRAGALGLDRVARRALHAVGRSPGIGKRFARLPGRSAAVPRAGTRPGLRQLRPGALARAARRAARPARVRARPARAAHADLRQPRPASRSARAAVHQPRAVKQSPSVKVRRADRSHRPARAPRARPHGVKGQLQGQ
jgi:RNA polymerase sigma-70 factor (ECF subfamily)